MSKVIEGLLYSESHEYAKIDSNIATVGITDYAQSSLGTVVFVDMPEEDDTVEQGELFGAVESVKAASDLISPVSGKVIEYNEALDENPELVNQDPYENWIIKVEIDADATDIFKLMTAEKYEEFLEKER